MTPYKYAVPSPARLVLLSGNTHRPSRSHALAAYLGDAVAGHLAVDPVHVDLIDAGRDLGTAYSPAELSGGARSVIAAIAGADALIVTAPVYKGSYPGLFKHLIDMLDTDALVGKPVLIGATGGGQRHALMAEHQLRPLFGFFSAQVAAYTIYASDSEFIDGVPAAPDLLARIERAARQFADTIAACGARVRQQAACAS